MNRARRRTAAERSLRVSLARKSSAYASLVCCVFAVASGLVDLNNPAGRPAAALTVGGVCLGVGALTVRSLQIQARRQPTRSVYAAVVVGWLTMIFVSAIFYLVGGATTSVADAVFESVAALTTTSFSTFADVETLSRGMLLWRAATQWMGGFATLVLLVAVLPRYLPVNVLDTKQESGLVTTRGGEDIRVREILAAYTGLTLICIGLYAVVGMGLFDSLCYAFSTASTGGLANHNEGLAHFSSAAVEWAAAAGMSLAGVSITAIWWAMRGRVRPLRESFELKVYAGLLLALSLLVWLAGWLANEAGGGEEGLRHAVFSVASGMSSTGFRLVDWSSWSWGLQFLMLGIIATGGMSHSAGGGFRLSRAIPAMQYAYRELIIQLHPNAVHVVKLGRRMVSERSLSFLNAFQVITGLVMVIGAFGLALGGVDLLGAISGAASALATMGPALGDLAPLREVSELSGTAMGFLACLMFLGKLLIYPVIIAAGLQVLRLSSTTLGALRQSRTSWVLRPRNPGRRLPSATERQ